MRTINVTRNYIFSETCTAEILAEIATRYCGYSQAAMQQLAEQQLAKGSAKRGNKSNASGALPQAKLRTCVVQKLQDSTDYGATFNSNELQLDIYCLAEQAAPKQQRTTKQALAGPYVVVTKERCKCTAETDAGKYEIWQHVWQCNTFEQYFAQAPKKAVTKTGRVITAASEINWAVARGWVKPVQHA